VKEVKEAGTGAERGGHYWKGEVKRGEISEEKKR